MDRPPSFLRLMRLTRPQLGSLLASSLLLLIGSAASLAAPRIAGSVVDAALLQQDLGQLDAVVLSLLGLFAVLGVTSFGQMYFLRRAGARLLAQLRGDVYGHLLRLTPDFHEQRRVGELLSRLGSDLTLVQSSLTDRIPDGLGSALTFAGTLVLLLVLHTRLTLVALALVPPVILLAVWWGSRLEKLSTAVQDALGEASALADESLVGIRTVQAFGREPHEEARYRMRLGQLLGLQLSNARAVAAFVGLLQFSAFSAFALVLWYGGRLILSGELTPGELTSFLLYTFAIAASVGTLGGLYGGYRELRGASARIFELLDTRPGVLERPDALELPRPQGRVALQGVRFAYPSGGGRIALQGIDLELAPGEMVGLVGPSGSGKSTLLSLLLRFRDPDAGAVTIDGHDLRSLRLADLRRWIGVVPQEIVLFSGSIEENLRYGAPEASAEQVRAAALAAGADEFIRRLPNGYEELVGERGVRLSAGQRQRIAIARVFLRDPAIVLLDEATSALDPESEEVVQQALGRLLHGRTTLVVAHRLATARRANRIVVLEAGRIAAVGGHAELHASSELYRRYWQLQSLQSEPLSPQS